MRTALLGLSFILLSASAVAEPTNFRAGLGMLRYDVTPAPDYMPSARDTGLTLMAEFPQSNYHGSRFILYALDSDTTGLWGYETQMLLGFGLAQPGFRVYTGPAWHREVIKRQTAQGADPVVFNGWGWQAGIGWQYQAVTLDLAATYRDTRDYRMENKIATGINTPPAPVLGNLLLSYRF